MPSHIGQVPPQVPPYGNCGIKNTYSILLPVPPPNKSHAPPRCPLKSGYLVTPLLEVGKAPMAEALTMGVLAFWAAVL